MNEYNLLKKKKFMITGGAGFIGSSLIRFLINETNNDVLNFYKLTYSSSYTHLKEFQKILVIILLKVMCVTRVLF